MDAPGPGGEELAWWSSFGNPTGWLSVNTFESLALRHRLFSVDLKCLCVRPLPAAPHQLLLSAAAWEDEMRPHF